MNLIKILFVLILLSIGMCIGAFLVDRRHIRDGINRGIRNPKGKWLPEFRLAIEK